MLFSILLFSVTSHAFGCHVVQQCDNFGNCFYNQVCDAPSEPEPYQPRPFGNPYLLDDAPKPLGTSDCHLVNINGNWVRSCD